MVIVMGASDNREGDTESARISAGVGRKRGVNRWAVVAGALFVVLCLLFLWLAFGHLLLHRSTTRERLLSVTNIEEDVAESAKANGNVQHVRCRQTTSTEWSCVVYFSGGRQTPAHARWYNVEETLGVSLGRQGTSTK